MMAGYGSSTAVSVDFSGNTHVSSLGFAVSSSQCVLTSVNGSQRHLVVLQPTSQIPPSRAQQLNQLAPLEVIEWLS